MAEAAGPALPGAVDLRPAFFQPARGDPRALILALHGFGDHAESAFAEAAELWAGDGIATLAYDQRGFGRGPERGRWPGAEGLVADLAAAAEAAAARFPGVPLVLLGHSMGGGVALAALGEGRVPQAAGAVLLAPAVAGGAHVPGLVRAGLWALAGAAPDRRWTGEGLIEVQASDNLALLRALAADPLYLGAPSGRELLGLVRVMDRAAAAAPDVAVPVLALLGERDQLIDLQAAEAALGRIPEAEVARLPQGWHMLLRDLNGRAARAAVARWTLDLAEAE